MEIQQHHRITIKYILLGIITIITFLHNDKIIGTGLMVLVILAFARYELSQIRPKEKKLISQIIDGKEYFWHMNILVQGLNKKADKITEEMILKCESEGFTVKFLPYGIDSKNKIFHNGEIHSIWKRERDSGGGVFRKPVFIPRKSLELRDISQKISPLAQKTKTKALRE